MDSSSEKNSIQTIIFSTTIKCQGCIDKVTPVLNQMSDIQSWEVDTQHPEKVLTVQSSNTDANRIIQALEEIGYKAVLKN
jgi:copper chaperone